jgi:hypothetical protein
MKTLDLQEVAEHAPGMNHLLTSALNRECNPLCILALLKRHGNGLSRVETERKLLLRRIVTKTVCYAAQPVEKGEIVVESQVGQ